MNLDGNYEWARQKSERDYKCVCALSELCVMCVCCVCACVIKKEMRKESLQKDSAYPDKHPNKLEHYRAVSRQQ